MRLTIEANEKKVGETNVASDDPRLLGAAVRSAFQRLQEVAQQPGVFVLKVEVHESDMPRSDSSAPGA